MERAAPPGVTLGRLADFAIGRAVCLKLHAEGGPLALVAVRRDNALRIYLNVCPHMGLPLDDLHEHILSGDGQRLVCSAQNAAFSVETGHAVRGLPPDCELTPVPIRVTAEGIVITA